MDPVQLSQQLQSFLRKEVAGLVVGFDSMARLMEMFGKFLFRKLTTSNEVVEATRSQGLVTTR